MVTAATNSESEAAMKQLKVCVVKCGTPKVFIT
jgi:hypothetical protein